ncbi:MAG: sigma-70 family RNA polymerase sigma factor [Gemmatimonadota bacterium]|nr:sigma-70 family RNA polymerase sigma factor [Gemmatimonadota bacterium]
MSDEGVSDADLVLRAREGDGGAFEALVRRYVRPALAVAWEFCHAREDAEDIVQDAFYRALRRIDRFDTDRPFAPWFFTIVRNLGRNAASRRSRWRLMRVPESLPGRQPAADAAERLEVRERIESALEDLTPRQRSCFRLCEMEGFARGEVARMLGMSESTVRVHLHRAKQSLREVLAPLVAGEDDGPPGSNEEKEAHG